MGQLRATVGEDRHEETLPRQQPLAGAQKRPDEAGRLLRAAVAEDGLHPHGVGHVHEGARLGDGALSRIELDLDELHLGAFDPEVDLVRGPAGRQGDGAVRVARQDALEGGHVAETLPFGHPGREYVGAVVGAAAADQRLDLGLGHRTDLVSAAGHVPLLFPTWGFLRSSIDCPTGQAAGGWSSSSTQIRALMPWETKQSGQGTRSTNSSA